MRPLLQGRTAIVTGAGSEDGIGYAVARLFADAGAAVVLADIRGNEAERLAAAIGRTQAGGSATGFALDVRDEEACRLCVEHATTRHGRLDAVVAGAGIVQTRRLATVTRQDLDAILDVNLRGTLAIAQAAEPHLGAGSSITCIASIAAQRGGGLMGGPHYAASKGGVLGLVKALARELAPRGIRVNAVNPGIVMTGMNRDAFDAERKAALLASVPLGRFGTPADVAGACLYLASDLAAYVTGTEADVNGGLHIH